MLVHRPERNPRQPSRQPYYGPMGPCDFIEANLPYLGQVNPVTSTIMHDWHGRYLSGVGRVPGVEGFSGEDPSGAIDVDPSYQDRQIYGLEEQDDVYGSGVFDAPGRQATAHAQTGIFASHYSLPGYVGREEPFTVSEVTDITDDADVVFVPAGGMSYAEVRGRMQPAPVLGPSPRPPGLRMTPPATDSRLTVYKNLQPGPPRQPLHAGAPRMPMPTYRPARRPVHWTADVPRMPIERTVPMATVERRLPFRPIVNPTPGLRGFGAAEMSDSAKMVAGAAVLGVVVGVAVELLSRKK